MNDLFVVCAPAQRPSGVPGAIAKSCGFCGMNVWVSPSTRAWQQRCLFTVAKMVCPACALRHSKATKHKIEEVGIPAEQAEEIYKLIGITGKDILEAMGITVRII